jgi:calcium/proton exchanger cax
MTAGAHYAMINAYGQFLVRITPHDRHDLLVFLSRSASTILLIMYCIFQIFRRTHSEQFQRDVEDWHAPEVLRTMRKTGSSVATALLLCTIWITYVCAIPILKAVAIQEDPTSGDPASYIPSLELFSFCLLPLLAELAEIPRTCSLSYQGEMDLSFEVATTTSIHMMLVVAPLFCISAWCMGTPLDLDLGDVAAIVLCLNIWLFSIVTRQGISDYLTGCLVYGL